MPPILDLLWKLTPLLLTIIFVGWVLWRWLKASDEPLALIGRWIITLVVLIPVLGFAARARDEFTKIAAVLAGAVGGLILTIVWRQRFCEWVGDLFGSLYTGGSQQVDPTPFYSIAQARRKQGRYSEAIAEVQGQLEKFPTDFTGWLLLAEIQAEDLKDLAAAQETIRTLLSQPGHAPKNIAFALNREADWHLKLARDRAGAHRALEQIVEILPDSEQAQLALQRIAHLTPDDMLEAKEQPRRVVVQKGAENIGLRDEPLQLAPTEEDPGVTAANLVAHLEQFPFDNEAREKLALLYARHYQRLDLAVDQLEQLVSFPNQPPKQVAHWLNLMADLQIELQGDAAAAKLSLNRIAELFPDSAAAENARNRIAYLALELRPKQGHRVLKLGTYEQNIGLKQGPFKHPSKGNEGES